jgi:hypothetical protein
MFVCCHCHCHCHMFICLCLSVAIAIAIAISISCRAVLYNTGYFSSTGYTPGCEVCPLGTTNSESGMAVCDICDEGYFGRDGEPPCTACPASYVSNEKKTGCYLCVGYEPGCSLSGGSSGSDSGGDSTSPNWISSSMSVLTGQIEDLGGKVRAQQSYIERYKRQRNL